MGKPDEPEKPRKPAKRSGDPGRPDMPYNPEYLAAIEAMYTTLRKSTTNTTGYLMGVDFAKELLGSGPPVQFVPSAQQQAILKALDGRALRQSQLVLETGLEPGQLHRENALTGLRRMHRVELHRRLGYYRPDALPPQLRPS